MPKLMERLRRLLKGEPGDPDDYAMVGAPKKPKPSGKRAAAAAPLE